MGSRRRDGDLLGGATASPIRDASSLLGVPDHPQQRRSFVEGRQHFLLLVEGEPKRRRPEFLLDPLPNFVILSLSLDLIHPILYTFLMASGARNRRIVSAPTRRGRPPGTSRTGASTVNCCEAHEFPTRPAPPATWDASTPDPECGWTSPGTGRTSDGTGLISTVPASSVD